MALVTYNATLDEWENIIRVKLKVVNPTLLKSGALGILANFLAGIKYDALQFYSKTFQEMNVGLAQDFNSMLYHSTVYGAELEFANPATLTSSLVIPELNLSQIEELIYEIPRYTTFVDNNGIPFIFISDIKMSLTNRGISAISWNPEGTKTLSVTKAANPNVANAYVYLVHNADVQQFKRDFHSFIVPQYDVGSSYTFSIGLPSITQLKEVRVWLNTGADKVDIQNLHLIAPEDIIDLNQDQNTDYNLIEMNIKYHKFDSSVYENNIFLTMYESTIYFETGNGLNGKIPPEGSQIIVEIQTTLGEEGNITNSEFLVPNIQVQEKLNNSNIYNSYTTNVNGLSTTGATGGFSVPDVDKIRETIFDQITIRNSVITENDYERLFEYQLIKPFVDAKFIHAQSYVFLFNVIHNNDQVVLSNTFNIKESELFNDPFYPELNYNGIQLVSPFYYKNHDENSVDAYLVNPEVVFALRPLILDETDLMNANFQFTLALVYDFAARKSYIKIIDGNQNNNYEYRFTSSVFNCLLDVNNEFTWEVNTMFTDPYCIVREPITNIKVTVYDTVGAPGSYEPVEVITYVDDDTYSQLILKQRFYKYFQELPDDAIFEADLKKDFTAYIDNNYNEIMSTTTDVFYYNTQNDVETYILRMPYIDSNFFYNQPASDVFELMDKYFMVNYLEENINFNTKLVQAFHNTIDIPPKYYPFLFEENTMDTLTSPKIPIEIEVFLDSNAFITSKFENITDLEISLKITIIKFLKKYEGFMIDFYETDLEKTLFNEFAPIIRNIKVITPSLFIVNDASTIYRGILNNLTFDDMLNFVPPFFYYDYDNIQLTIQM
jgi:hypothetical protein